jgi:hypothetical protein
MTAEVVRTRMSVTLVDFHRNVGVLEGYETFDRARDANAIFT